MNAANAASLATGGGQATNVYSGGVFDLGPDEALLIENAVPVVPQYSGFHLSNLWGESLDFANHQSSLNIFQAEADADGVRRYVIAHRDPGVPNWVDTTGLPQGFLTFRWAYSELPPQLPTVKVTKVREGEIRKHLPSGTRTVSASERREAIRVRHYSRRTEETYLDWVRRYIRFHGRRHPREQVLLAQQHFGARVVQHESQSLGRIGCIERQVGATRFQHGQDAHDHGWRALGTKADDGVGTDAQLPQVPRQKASAANQAAIRPALGSQLDCHG